VQNEIKQLKLFFFGTKGKKKTNTKVKAKKKIES
jgi:hypothetical protein